MTRPDIDKLKTLLRQAEGSLPVVEELANVHIRRELPALLEYVAELEEQVNVWRGRWHDALNERAEALGVVAKYEQDDAEREHIKGWSSLDDEEK